MLRGLFAVAAVALMLAGCSGSTPLGGDGPTTTGSLVTTAAGGTMVEEAGLQPPSPAAKLLAARAIARVTGTAPVIQ